MKQIIVAFFFICSSFLFSEIVETSHFSEMSRHLTEETLILIDIDDTLLIPKQMLGCDEWFMARFKQYVDKGHTNKEALEKTLPEFEAIRHLSQMELVELKASQFVQDLQEKGYCVMGLTTQGLGLATRTVHQLSGHNIDLSKTAPSREEHYISPAAHGVIFRGGILFTSGTHKGEALFTLLDKIGYSPKRILFINDKAANLFEVEVMAEKRNVPFIGLRYAYSDAKKARYSHDIAEVQFHHSSFGTLLSDDEARVFLESSFTKLK